MLERIIIVILLFLTLFLCCECMKLSKSSEEMKTIIQITTSKEYEDKICRGIQKQNEAYEIITSPIINGMYYLGENYYCIDARRNVTEQEATERHEYCHYLIDNDYSHFCYKDD